LTLHIFTYKHAEITFFSDDAKKRTEAAQLLVQQQEILYTGFVLYDTYKLNLMSVFSYQFRLFG